MDRHWPQLPAGACAGGEAHALLGTSDEINFNVYQVAQKKMVELRYKSIMLDHADNHVNNHVSNHVSNHVKSWKMVFQLFRDRSH